MDLIDKTEEALDKELCDHCLGRLFAQLGHGLTNDERGRSLRAVFAMERSDGDRESVPEEPEECTLCGDIFDEVDKFASIIVEEFKDIEYDTFLVGSRIDPMIEEREEQLWVDLNVSTSEPIKTEMNREVGKRVLERVDGEVDLERPDLKGIIDTRFDALEIEIAPEFFYGRYRKVERGIPQTRWTCRQCWGDGCEKCDGTGKIYQTSVEEEIGEPLMEAAFGEDYTLHGMGREDVDAKMVGNGRPFVLEISEPLKRDLDLEEVTGWIEKGGRVEVSGLMESTKEKVREIKQKDVPKSYLVTVSWEGDLERAKFKKVLQSLRGEKISQKTPKRVSQSRADKVREREILNTRLEDWNEGTADLRLKCQAGTYIKEFIHSDDGRTSPNLSNSAGVEFEVKKLDVMEVHYVSET